MAVAGWVGLGVAVAGCACAPGGGTGTAARWTGRATAAWRWMRAAASALTRLLEVGGALGGAAGPLAQALDLTGLGEDEQGEDRDPTRAAKAAIAPIFVETSA